MKSSHFQHPTTTMRWIALILTLIIVMMTALSCADPKPSQDPDKNPETPDQDTVKEPDENSDPTPDTTLEIRVTVLSGTTGFSMAPLMQSSSDGKSVLKYQFSVENDASNVTAALINGDIDIAALPMPPQPFTKKPAVQSIYWPLTP